MIESFDSLKDPEAFAVLVQAFADHPVLPPGAPPRTAEELLRLMMVTFSGTGRAWLHGIRRNGAPVCVAFSLDAQSEPKGFAMILFFIGLFRILGWRIAVEFMRGFARRPKYKDRYLELMLLGTLPAFHGQGLGKSMLAFLYGFAEERGYRGVILGAARETPAYRFYVKEGFVTDSEIMMNDIPLCNMRRDNA